jgi:hypothetical protein
VFDIALEIPLAAFALGGLGQGDDAGGAHRQMLGYPLDRSVLAGGVATLEDHQAALALFDGPDLEPDQGDLQRLELFGVVLHALTLAVDSGGA